MVKAPEKLAPAQPGEPKPPTRSPRKRRLLALGMAGAVALGGGTAAATLLSGKSEPKPAVSGEGKGPKKSESPSPTRSEQVTPREQQIAQLETNIEKAFALTDEQIISYGKENPITYRDRGDAWTFPHWYNNTSLLTDDQRALTSLQYSTGYSIKAGPDLTFEPNFSIFGADFEHKGFKLLAIRLGSIDEPLSSGGTERIGVYFLRFSSQMGSYRFVNFITEHVDDPRDKRFQSGSPIDYYGESPSIQVQTQYDFSDSVDYEPISQADFYKRLDALTGKPVVVDITFDYSNIESVFPDINTIVSKNRVLYEATLALFQGNPSAFNTALQKAADQGLIILPDNPVLPEWLTQGRNTVDEYLEFAQLGGMSYFKGIESIFEKQRKNKNTEAP